jgi:hypothetical protein
LTAPDRALVWHMAQIGLAGSANCCEWQPAQRACPGRLGFVVPAARV